MEEKPKLPDKLYFRIGEVSKLLGLQPSVLRYWETEFRFVKPIKSRGGMRLYRRSDIDHLGLIKDLLYNQKFTIAGARAQIRALGLEKSLEEKEKRDQLDVQLILKSIKERVRNLRGLVERMEKKLGGGM